MIQGGKTSIFLTGATGYIGGAVLAKLLSHPSAGTFEITALVRNTDKANILKSKFDVNVVTGTHQELDKIHDLAMQSHVVFHLADSDDVAFIKALLSGMKDRHAKVGDLPILIHTSGTGVLTDDARGEYATDTIYSDLNIEQIRSIPPTAVHRHVDLQVIDADEQGYARTHIVFPATIYGIAQHALVDAGVSNPHSVQVPGIIKASIDRKRAGMVGKGKACWQDVHIDDVAELYILLFDSIVSNPDKTGHGWEGLYFGANGEHSWYDIGKAIGEAFVELGISAPGEAEPTPFTVDELVKYWGNEYWGWYNGSNSRCRADRGRLLGWKPKYTTTDFLKSILTEIKALMKQSSTDAYVWRLIPEPY